MLVIRTSLWDFIAFQPCWHLWELAKACSESAYVCPNCSHKLLNAPESQTLLSGYSFAELTPQSLSLNFSKEFLPCTGSCLISHVTNGPGASRRIQIHRSSLFRKHGHESDSTITPNPDEHRKDTAHYADMRNRQGDWSHFQYTEFISLTKAIYLREIWAFYNDPTHSYQEYK